MGDTQNGWSIRENPIKMDDLEVPLFQETTIYIYLYLSISLSLSLKVIITTKMMTKGVSLCVKGAYTTVSMTPMSWSATDIER